MDRLLTKMLRGVCCFFLLVTMIGCTSTDSARQKDVSATSTSQSVKISEESINGLKMVNSKIGWAWGVGRIFTTNDNHWSKAGPSSLGKEEALSASCIDTETAFFVTNGSEGKPNTNVFSTSDGGVNWSVFQIPQANTRSEISFSDLKNGWIMLFGDVGAGSNPVELFRTQDGGKNWTKAAPASEQEGIPVTGVKNGITAIDSLTCWATGQSNQNGTVFLYKTKDGGSHWLVQKLNMPTDSKNSLITTYSPVFFGQKEGLLTVVFEANNKKANLLLATHDGGDNWQQASLIEMPASESEVTYYPLDMNQIWGFNGKNLMRTINGGKVWNTFGMPLPDGITKFNFIDDKTGWGFGKGIARTEDGGKHWAAVN